MRSMFRTGFLGGLFFAGASHAQTAITYQGELRAGGTLANGVYDLRFTLFDAATAGTQVGSALCFDDVSVTDGRFTLSLDFGAVYTAPRFLQIQAREGSAGTCAFILGYTALSPRQPLSPAPSATHAGTSGNAGQLEGQGAAFYRSASNLTGTLSDARLSGNVARLDLPGTFSGIPNFNGGLSGSTAPFVVDSTTRVANLNADLLDGADSSAFAAASHTHDANAINAGTLADARLSANIARLASANIFTGLQTINVTGQGALSLASNSTGGTWQTITNTSSGGRAWNLISTGIGNSEGAGKLLVRDGAASAVRAVFDVDGDIGVGTINPIARLEAVGPDARFHLRNANDQGSTFIQQTYNSMQLGLVNYDSVNAWETIPAGRSRSFFGFDAAGRVGSLTNAYQYPGGATAPAAFRNILDDGNGNASIQGNLNARNLPAVAHVSTNIGSDVFRNDSRTIIENITANIPGDGFLWVSCRVSVNIYGEGPCFSTMFLELKETTGSEVLVRESELDRRNSGLGSGSLVADMTLDYCVPVTAGIKRFKVRLRHAGDSVCGVNVGGRCVKGGEITAMYFPRGL
jgi:hypothetical protein